MHLQNNLGTTEVKLQIMCCPSCTMGYLGEHCRLFNIPVYIVGDFSLEQEFEVFLFLLKYAAMCGLLYSLEGKK